MIVIDEYLAVRVLGGDLPDALPDDELGLPASGDSRRLLLLVPPQSRWSGSLAVEECDEFARFVLDGFYSGGNGAYIERTGGTQRSLPDERGQGQVGSAGGPLDDGEFVSSKPY